MKLRTDMSSNKEFEFKIETINLNTKNSQTVKLKNPYLLSPQMLPKTVQIGERYNVKR